LAGEQVPSTYDTVLLRKDNSKVFVELSAGIIQYGGKPADLVIVRDITERKRIEETLHASEERYRILAEASHDLIYVVNLDGYIEYVNTFAAQQLGMPPDKVIGKPWKKFVDPPVAERQNRHLKSVIETGEPKRTEEQLQFLGRKVWLSTWLVPLRDPSGVVSAVMGVSRDISERKVREHELREAKDRLEKRVAERTAKLAASHEQLRRLTQKVVLAQEEERRMVSRELHDEAGQALIGLRFSMDAILADTPAELAPLRKRLAETTALITQMMERIQSLAYSLRPPVLEIVGINLGLKDLCSEFSERTHLSVNYTGLDLPNLPDEISISFYRFLQETMTNVVKHAHASQVQITLDYKDGTITLSVEDNGKGFRHKTNQRGIGLLGLEERLRLLGGRLAIKSRLGHGSRVTAYIPWRSDETEIRV
jgi:PAS domain S-box-containing protein